MLDKSMVKRIAMQSGCQDLPEPADSQTLRYFLPTAAEELVRETLAELKDNVVSASLLGLGTSGVLAVTIVCKTDDDRRIVDRALETTRQIIPAIPLTGSQESQD